MKVPISVVIITKNEADILAQTLTPLSHFSEVLIVDSGSSDDTLVVSRKYGCRVLYREWSGFGDQKSFAVRHAKHDWVLSIDADEVLTRELVAEILALDLSDLNVAYEIRRRNFFLGREVKFSGWNPDWVLRLFNRNYGNFSNCKVHERVHHRGLSRRLSGRMLHYSYRSPADVERKVALYAESASAGRFRGAWYATLSAGYTFLRTYLLRLGFLDGLVGFKIAVMNSKVNYKKYS